MRSRGQASSLSKLKQDELCIQQEFWAQYDTRLKQASDATNHVINHLEIVLPFFKERRQISARVGHRKERLRGLAEKWISLYTAKMTGLVVLPHWGHNMGPKRISPELHLPAIVQGSFESLEIVLSGNKTLTNTWLSRNFGLDIGRAHKQPLLETELCDTGDRNQRSFWRDPHSVNQANPRGHKSLAGNPGCGPASRKRIQCHFEACLRYMLL